MDNFETDRVDAWSCGVCGAVYSKKSEADGCCRCTGCHGKFVKENHFGSECEGCLWKVRVRHARGDIRRYKGMLADKEKFLAQMLANRPPKASDAP